MSKIKLLTIAVIGLLVINAGMLVFGFFARPGRPGTMRIPAGEGPKQIIIERLHFTKDQVTAYEKLIDEHRSKIRTLEEDIRGTKNDLYQTLADDTRQEKDSLQDRLGELQKEIEQTHYDHFAAIRKICTPGQLPQYNELTKDLARLFAPVKNLQPPPRD